LGVLHPDMPLDWALDGDEGEDPSLTILDAIDEEFHRKTLVACQKTKGMRELLNLKSTINYGKRTLSVLEREGSHEVVLSASWVLGF
jgi:hypothetical protein